MKEAAELGDEVRCKITGFKGVLVGKAVCLTGCDRGNVQAPMQKDGKCGEAWWVDMPALEVVTKAKVKKEDVQSEARDKKGGPMSRSLRMF